MRKVVPGNCIGFLSLLLMSCLTVAVFHRRAAAPELRYLCVAEGNISQGISGILSGGISGFGAAIHREAKEWGRVRPVHQLFHSVSFLITMVRNGDLWHSDPEVPRKNRMNGDLQTHTLVQMFVTSLTVSVFGWLIWRTTQVWWAAFLLPLVFVVANRCLGENLLVNYCDSGEIGQLFFVSLYLLSLRRPLAGNAPTPGVEMTGAFLLALAYGMKETTVVVLPAVLGVLCLRLVPAFHPAPGFKRYLARHAASHVAMAGILMLYVYLHRSGEYVAVNYQMKTALTTSAIRSWRLLGLPAELVSASIVGLFAGIAALFAEWRAPRRLPGLAVDSTSLLLLCGALAAGFWAVNLPWSGALRKYYLPAYFFASAFAVTIIVLVGSSLRRQKLQPAAWLWLAGSVVFVLGNASASQAEIKRYYRKNYEYRKVVPAVAADIAASVRSGTPPSRIRLIAGRMFPEGALHFSRVANRTHHLNIAWNGDVVSSVGAVERNYFRRYSGAAAVEIAMSESLPLALDDDRVYVIAGAVPDEEIAMLARGYRLSRRWDVGTPATRIALYMKP